MQYSGPRMLAAHPILAARHILHGILHKIPRAAIKEKVMRLCSLDKYRDLGLLMLRVGMGVMFMGHGLPKLIAGPEKWALLGGAMNAVGVDFAPMVWGCLAAVSESAGGMLLALGFFTRPACFFLLNTMIVAAAMHIGNGDSFGKYAHAVEAGILFLSLLFIGPGKYSLDDRLSAIRRARPANGAKSYGKKDCQDQG